jgi:hypothetical protein
MLVKLFLCVKDTVMNVCSGYGSKAQYMHHQGNGWNMSYLYVSKVNRLKWHIRFARAHNKYNLRKDQYSRIRI